MRFLVLFLSIMTIGCLPKSAPLPAINGSQVDVVVLQNSPNSTDWAPGPTATTQALQNAFVESGLSLVSDSSAATPADTSRTFEARFAAKKPGTSGELLLYVEISAQYFSQIQGQYRWVLSGHIGASLLDGEDLHTNNMSFEFPVFLDHPHEKETAAIEAAVPMLLRHIDQLLRHGPLLQR